MTTLNVSLPDTIERWLHDQSIRDGFGSVSDYVASLIQAEHHRRGENKLRQLIQAGIDSGEPVEITEEFWKQKHKEIDERGWPRDE